MRKSQPTRIGATVCAVVALLAMSLLPAEHVHRSEVGRALVHRHVAHAMDEVVGHAGSSIDHGDPAGVTTVDPTLGSPRQYVLDRPLSPTDVLLVAPTPRVAARVEARDVPMTHGPPLRVDSLRAPPA